MFKTAAERREHIAALAQQRRAPVQAFGRFNVNDRVRIKGTRKTGFVNAIGDSAGGDTWYHCVINGQSIAVVGSDLEPA